MAKARSKKITLEDALVPVEEQPYEVPENWCWTRIKYVSNIVTGSTPSKKNEKYYGGDFPFFKPADLDAEDNVIEASEYLSEEGRDVSRIIPELSTAVCCIGSIGKSGLLRVEGTTNQQINSMIPKINPLYLYYYSKTNDFVVELWNKSTATTISLVNKNNMGTNTFPLAPLAEQQRIVEQIESLFAKLDEAKEKAQEVIDGYEVRNAGVYNAAFSGMLTAQWRKDNYKENKWETKRFDEVADIKSNLVEPSNYLEYPHIAPDNIEKRTGILLDYHTIAEDGVKSGKHRFYAGQILYSKIRPYLSKVVMVDFDGLCSADMYPIEAKENTKYLLYYMLSDMFLEQASSAGSRSVLPKINQKELSAIKVRITSAEEQEEVVRILDYILPMMQQVRDKAIQVVDNIDTMKKAILAKAFRGELGTNIETEESAIELLKSIL